MINLKNNYCIVSDGNSYTLCKIRKSVSAEGIETYVLDRRSFHSTLEYALQSYSNSVMADLVSNVDMDLKEVKKAIEKLKEELKAYD